MEIAGWVWESRQNSLPTTTQEDILITDEYESDDCVKLVVIDDLINADKKYMQRLKTIVLMVDITRFVQST